MSHAEVKDTVQDAGKAVTPELSSSKDESKGGKTPAAGNDAVDEGPKFKQYEVEMGFLLYRSIKRHDNDGNKKDPEIDTEKFMKLGGYSKSSVSTVIGRLKRRIREIEEAKGETYKGIDNTGAAKTPKKPRVTAVIPKTPGGKGKRKAAESDDEAPPNTPVTKKLRACARKVQKVVEEGESGDDDVPETPVTPTPRKGRAKKAIIPKVDAEGADGEDAETPRAERPRAPRKKVDSAATSNRGRKKATAELQAATNEEGFGESSKTDGVDDNNGGNKNGVLYIGDDSAVEL